MRVSEKGQGFVEYALILVLVAIAYIASLMIFGPNISGYFPYLPFWGVLLIVAGVDLGSVLLVVGLIFLMLKMNVGDMWIEYALIGVLTAIVIIAAMEILPALIGPISTLR